ncbi:unnamed protein product (mitochondrion) [Plasmodiophora brassicae]|uniref:Glycosyl transferase 64 domain-containing protein n=1 Tax=Plasmodiophora brassicae TaxID=37360 RepID=A0A0G4ITH6_PLABS|nr:hypothetical protein PBRA_006689 [Plasmodiophora brassicae]SPQ95798.1 unnamed protein product [Plasmodiophora brassicae]
MPILWGHLRALMMAIIVLAALSLVVVLYVTDRPASNSWRGRSWVSNGTVRALSKGAPVPITIVMMTYRRVEALLANPVFRDIVPLREVDRAILVWNDAASDPPPALTQHFQSLGIADKVVIIRPKRNSLNNRYVPYDAIRTSTVFTIDDDFQVDVTGFRIGLFWAMRHPTRLVGFYPRRLRRDPPTYEFPSRAGDSYNALLPGGGLFMPVRFLHAYSSATYDAQRTFVDDVGNCEDILLQFVVPPGMHPPLLIAPTSGRLDSFTRPFTSDEYDRRTGISRAPGHPQKRLRCIERFANDLGWPLVESTAFQSRSPTH